ncbi:MAG: UDP-N-acetylmuramate dehydrogenase [Spongiibacteraceae bacterium]
MTNFFIDENFDLQAFNTLALSARARYFASITTVDALRQALIWARDKNLPLLTLGGGSNMILAGDWPGLVLHIALLGKTIEDETRVRVGAGENWHDLVQWSLAQNLYGLENLTLIPGTAGAAPILNIGAYGVEIAERLVSVRGIDVERGYECVLSAAECQLVYRDSIFKNTLRNRFIITEITLGLSRTFTPVIAYPALRETLADIAAPTAVDVERAVRQIRQSRLPDPALLPNAGSFFKNPVVSAQVFADLQFEYPEIPHFPAADGVKIPAAWLVEQCGWKGRRVGAVGVHEKQALVLIHYREALATRNVAGELLDLAATIQSDVCQRFLIVLELEPTVYGG